VTRLVQIRMEEILHESAYRFEREHSVQDLQHVLEPMHVFSCQLLFEIFDIARNLFQVLALALELFLCVGELFVLESQTVNPSLQSSGEEGIVANEHDAEQRQGHQERRRRQSPHVPRHKPQHEAE